MTGLCTYKATADLKDEHALTPLHKAAAQGHAEAAEQLLAHNADPNATDEVPPMLLIATLMNTIIQVLVATHAA